MFDNLGCFVIWQSGERNARFVLDQLMSQYVVLHAQTVHWDHASICTRLNHLYPHRNFDLKDRKVLEVGANNQGVRLHVIILRDDAPDFFDGVNLNFKKFKDVLRVKYKNNFLHCSDNYAEAKLNIKSLINQDIDIYANNKPKYIVLDQSNKKILSSTAKEMFVSIEEAFEELNQEGIQWLLMRNWESLEQELISQDHGDVDLLVDRFFLTIKALRAKCINFADGRVQYTVRINNKNIPFDIRYVGDDYYDRFWQEDMLDKRVEFGKFYVMDKNNYFYSLLYHGLIHKPFLSEEYRAKLESFNLESPDLRTLKNY